MVEIQTTHLWKGRITQHLFIYLCYSSSPTHKSNQFWIVPTHQLTPEWVTQASVSHFVHIVSWQIPCQRPLHRFKLLIDCIREWLLSCTTSAIIQTSCLPKQLLCSPPTRKMWTRHTFSAASIDNLVVDLGKRSQKLCFLPDAQYTPCTDSTD